MSKIPYKFDPFGKGSGGLSTPLTLTAEENNSSVNLTKVGDPNTSGLKYRLKGNWEPYEIDTVINLNKGDYVQFLNTENRLSLDGSNRVGFVMTGKIKASGNIQSLLNYSEQVADNSFRQLFENCTSLTQAPLMPGTALLGAYTFMYQGCTNLVKAPDVLPTLTPGIAAYYAMFAECSSLVTSPVIEATTLSQNCCYQMFNGCSRLQNVPDLKATTLNSGSCYQMFLNCLSLVNAPALPATTLAANCYNGMFKSCTSLANAPALTATNLGVGSYQSMFEGCTSLITAPELSSTTLTQSCYNSMFRGCTELVNTSELPALTVPTQAYESMFHGCTSLVTSPSIKASTLYNYSCVNMFNGCSSLVNVNDLSATSLNTSCCGGMFRGCTSLVTAPALPATTLSQTCYNNMFNGCTSLVNAPTLPATTLVEGCYQDMFQGCSKVNSIKVGFSSWLEGATTNWLNGVSASGTFTAPAGLTDTRGVNNIPTGWTLVQLNYKQGVSYLESTGTQYINTGISPDFANGDEVKISLYKASFTGGQPCAFGSRGQNVTNGVYALANGIIVADNSSNATINWAGYGDSVVEINDNEIKINQESVTMPKRVTCAYPMYLFALNSSNSMIVPYNGLRIYDWKYYNNGVLTQHLIPALDANDVPCMYDTISDTCVYNAGTGTFNYA